MVWVLRPSKPITYHDDYVICALANLGVWSVLEGNSTPGGLALGNDFANAGMGADFSMKNRKNDCPRYV